MAVSLLHKIDKGDAIDVPIPDTELVVSGDPTIVVTVESDVAAETKGWVSSGPPSHSSKILPCLGSGVSIPKRPKAPPSSSPLISSSSP